MALYSSALTPAVEIQGVLHSKATDTFVRLIPHTPYHIPHTSYPIPHTPYLIPHTTYPIPHTPYHIPLNPHGDESGDAFETQRAEMPAPQSQPLIEQPIFPCFSFPYPTQFLLLSHRPATSRPMTHDPRSTPHDSRPTPHDSRPNPPFPPEKDGQHNPDRRHDPETRRISPVPA